MITDKFIRELEEIVGKEHVSVSRANTELYSYDASLARGKPGVVIFPGDSRETARIVRSAHRAGIPNLPPDAIDLDLLQQPDRIVEILCDARPQCQSWRKIGEPLACTASTTGFHAHAPRKAPWIRRYCAMWEPSSSQCRCTASHSRPCSGQHRRALTTHRCVACTEVSPS